MREASTRELRRRITARRVCFTTQGDPNTEQDAGAWLAENLRKDVDAYIERIAPKQVMIGYKHNVVRCVCYTYILTHTTIVPVP